MYLSLARALVLRLDLALVFCFSMSTEALLELVFRSSTLPNQVFAFPIAKSQTRNT
jgi:energy-converting hydrogenase Eha subunit F